VRSDRFGPCTFEAFEGLEISVATPAMLYRLKKDTVRWKDRIDAAALRERFGLKD
jgi:hypothetical protein